MENWKRNQSHYQSQLEMLNPQRTLERGYAVILSKEANQLHAVRKPNELNTAYGFEIHLAEGQAEVHFAKVDQIESKWYVSTISKADHLNRRILFASDAFWLS